MIPEQKLSPVQTCSQAPPPRLQKSRRTFPRVKMKLPVQIGLSGGRVVCAHTFNLSQDGMQIRCDRASARAVHPSGEPIPEGRGPEVLVVLRLRHDGQLRSHVLRCQLSYIAMTSDKEVAFGLRFKDLLEEQRDAIDAVLMESLQWRQQVLRSVGG